jgi:hypothetical protein
MAARALSDIVSLIDGNRSIRDLAVSLAAQNNLGREPMEASLCHFFTKLYEETRVRTFYYEMLPTGLLC